MCHHAQPNYKSCSYKLEKLLGQLANMVSYSWIAIADWSSQQALSGGLCALWLLPSPLPPPPLTPPTPLLTFLMDIQLCSFCFNLVVFPFTLHYSHLGSYE